LPEQGWPTDVLIDLLLMQEGIGELRLWHPPCAISAVIVGRPYGIWPNQQSAQHLID
jgi:hypothetical protein